MTTATAPDYMRQTGIFDPSLHEHASCTFVGVGGIGSFAAFAVAKLGIPNITLIDPDVVEAHNLPSQMFALNHDGDTKVEAVESQILNNTGNFGVAMHQAKITEDGWQSPDGDPYDNGQSPFDIGKLRGVVVSGLDSMKARHDLWHQCLRMNVNVPLYLDGRLDGQLLVIYAVCPHNLDDIEQYEATLLSDDEVPAGVCTARNIIDVGFTVGAQIARAVRLHYTDTPPDKITVINQATNTITKGGWIGS
jgi:hypothetical protein